MADQTDASGLLNTGGAQTETGALDKPLFDGQKEPAATKEVADKGLSIPTDKATPEEWDSFYTKMGRPEKAEEYELPVPEGDKGEFAKEIAPVLHKAGLSKTQAQTLAKSWNEMQASQQEAMKKAQDAEATKATAKAEADVVDLKNEWGEKFDENIEFARRAKAQFFPAENSDAVIDAIAGVVGLKATMKLMQDIGKGLAEDNATGLDGRGGNKSKSAAEVLFDKS